MLLVALWGRQVDILVLEHLECVKIQCSGVPNTSGFRSNLELRQHYADHGAEFRVTTIAEYEALADALWADPKPAHIHEYRRRRGDIIRYDPTTEAFGVVDNKSVIRTFFKPIPCASISVVVERIMMKQSGKCHDYATNLEYFRVRCQQW